MRDADLPLAPSQEGMWEFVKAFLPVGATGSELTVAGTNVSGTMTLDGPVDRVALRAALADVVRRQDALRLVFTDTGHDPLLRFEPEAGDPPLEVIDLSGKPAGRREALLHSVLAYQGDRPFTLTRWPLWSACLVRMSDTRHVVIVSLFHLIADGWSTTVFLRDLHAAYEARRGLRAPPPPPPVSYRDLVGAQPDRADRARRIEYWKRHLTPLPDAFPFPATDTSDHIDHTTGTSIGFAPRPEVMRALHRFAWTSRTTPFIALLAAHRILLARWTGWDRVIVGTPLFGRDAPGTTRLIGQFTNNIYLATRVTPEMLLTDVLGAVHEAMLDGVRNVASFKEIARAVNPGFEHHRPWPFLHLYHAWFQSAAPRNSGRPPAGVEAVWERSHIPRPTIPAAGFGGLELWAKRGEPGAQVYDDRRGGEFVYNPTVFAPDVVAEVARGYESVIEALVRDPRQRVADVTLPSTTRS